MNRPTPETDGNAFYGGYVLKSAPVVSADFARRLERQRDAAVETLKRVLARWDEGNKVEWCKSVREDASAVLREIEGKS